MFYLPLPILIFIVLIIAMPLLLFLIQLNIINIAFNNLGLSSAGAFLYFAGTIILSTVNIPVYRKKQVYTFEDNSSYFPMLRKSVRDSVIAVNLGGALLPLLMSLYLMRNLSLKSLIPGLFVVTISSYFSSRPVKHTGIAVIFPVPFLAAVISALVFADAPLRAGYAFVCGTMGILLGADILHLNKWRDIGAGILSIGGAGVFDSIFFIGLLCALIF